MSNSQRSVRAIRFEHRENQLTMLLTVEVGSEILVETIHIGNVDQKLLKEAAESAIRAIESAESGLVSAA